MKTYHKIQTVFKRDPATKHKTLLEGEYSLPEFEYLKDNEWVFTEKVDGTNIRVIYSPLEAGLPVIEFKGRGESSQMPATLYKALEKIFDPLHGKLGELFEQAPVYLYGEGYGPKIQTAGKRYRQDQSFVLFDVKVGEWWLHRKSVEDIAGKLGIDVVPVIGRGTLSDMVDYARAGIESTWGDFQAEGIVARPMTELCTRAGERIITKIKCKDFRKCKDFEK